MGPWYFHGKHEGLQDAFSLASLRVKDLAVKILDTFILQCCWRRNQSYPDVERQKRNPVHQIWPFLLKPGTYTQP